MSLNKRMQSIRFLVIAALLGSVVLSIVGCGYTAEIQVVPVGSKNVLELTAPDIVKIMKRSGFSDQQILTYGPQVKDSLARSGGVQIMVGRTVEAIFGVSGNEIYITTRASGSFIYNVNTGWVR